MLAALGATEAGRQSSLLSEYGATQEQARQVQAQQAEAQFNDFLRRQGLGTQFTTGLLQGFPNIGGTQTVSGTTKQRRKVMDNETRRGRRRGTRTPTLLGAMGGNQAGEDDRRRSGTALSGALMGAALARCSDLGYFVDGLAGAALGGATGGKGTRPSAALHNDAGPQAPGAPPAQPPVMPNALRVNTSLPQIPQLGDGLRCFRCRQRSN